LAVNADRKERKMFRRDTPPRGLRWTTQGLLLLAVTMVGCGTGPASVSGTVRFKGQPLPSGTVLFHGSDGSVGHSLIDANGKYTLTNPPLGPVRITVQSHPVLPTKITGRFSMPPAAPPELTPKAPDERKTRVVPIPLRYRGPETSGLTCTVNAGSQRHNIDLQP
jgi:hypothetical protein